MKVFLIILAVLVLLVIAICSLSATITVIYDKGWTTKLGVLFIEKDIELSKILSFILFPEKKAQEVSENQKKKESEVKAEDKAKSIHEEEIVDKPEQTAVEKAQDTDKKAEDEEQKTQPEQKKAEPKPNPILKLWNEEGIVGILSLVGNLLETANSAILTLIRGLHIYSLYVMIIVGGYDADMIGRFYGKICQYYYPVKGIILNQMKVDDYDDVIYPDFLADRTEYEFQLIASISVGLLLKVVLKAGFVFLKNLIQNKKGNK